MVMSREINWIFSILVFFIPVCCAVYCGKPVQENKDKSEYPYVAILEFRGKAFCGCTIISKNAVVTGAHCLEDPSITPKIQASDYQVRAGTYRTDSSSSSDNVQLIGAKEIYPHEDYDEVVARDSDIGIVLLKDEFTFTQFVNKINIATERQRDSTYEKDIVLLGWGDTETGQSSSVLRQADMKLISRKTCKPKVPKSVTLSYKMICALGSNCDTTACAGDSGGPIIRRAQNSEEKDILVGITSFGVPVHVGGICNPLFPLTLTDVTAFTSWIYKKAQIACPIRKKKCSFLNKIFCQ